MADATFSTKEAELKIELGLANGSGVGADASTRIAGLSKVEVLKFANDPFLVMLRRSLLALFWLLWLGMLAGAVTIIVMTPGCAKPKERQWYETSAVYTIRVDQFADSNGDGIGDLAGIIEKLDYIRNDIFMQAIALEGLLDKSDLSLIAPTLGTLDDFRNLSAKIKVIVKIPLGDVGQDTQKSIEIDLALTKWLDAGAAGFILDDFNDDEASLTDGLPGWHSIVANASNPAADDAHETSRFLAIATRGFKEVSNSFCRYIHMVLNYDMVKLSQSFDSSELNVPLAELEIAPNGSAVCHYNFVLGAANVRPLYDRFEPRSRAEAMLIFSMLADAAPFVYYGDEYGKPDTSGEPKTRDLTYLPDPSTGKMDWDDVNRVKRLPEKNQFKLFQQLAQLRLVEAAIRQGSTAVRDLDSSVLAMARIKSGHPGFVVASNFHADPVTVDLRTRLSSRLPVQGFVVLTSLNSRRHFDELLQLDSLKLDGEETLVLQFVPEPPPKSESAASH